MPETYRQLCMKNADSTLQHYNKREYFQYDVNKKVEATKYIQTIKVCPTSF